MDLSKILSIAGKPGLYQILNQSRGGVVVASLQDGKKTTVGQTQRVSTLSDISIYTYEGDEPLENILKSMYKYANGGKLEIDIKDNDALRGFFLEILPDHDEDRVYASDIKKIVKWYNLMVGKDLLDFSEEVDAETEESSSEESKEEEE